MSDPVGGGGGWFSGWIPRGAPAEVPDEHGILPSEREEDDRLNVKAALEHVVDDLSTLNIDLASRKGSDSIEILGKVRSLGRKINYIQTEELAGRTADGSRAIEERTSQEFHAQIETLTNRLAEHGISLNSDTPAGRACAREPAKVEEIWNEREQRYNPDILLDRANARLVRIGPARPGEESQRVIPEPVEEYFRACFAQMPELAVNFSDYLDRLESLESVVREELQASPIALSSRGTRTEVAEAFTHMLLALRSNQQELQEAGIVLLSELHGEDTKTLTLLAETVALMNEQIYQDDLLAEGDATPQSLAKLEEQPGREMFLPSNSTLQRFWTPGMQRDRQGAPIPSRRLDAVQFMVSWRREQVLDDETAEEESGDNFDLMKVSDQHKLQDPQLDRQLAWMFGEEGHLISEQATLRFSDLPWADVPGETDTDKIHYVFNVMREHARLLTTGVPRGNQLGIDLHGKSWEERLLEDDFDSLLIDHYFSDCSDEQKDSIESILFGFNRRNIRIMIENFTAYHQPEA